MYSLSVWAFKAVVQVHAGIHIYTGGYFLVTGPLRAKYVQLLLWAGVSSIRLHDFWNWAYAKFIISSSMSCVLPFGFKPLYLY